MSISIFIFRQKEDLPLSSDNRIKIYSDDKGNTKLVITDVRESDGGLYFCTAESKAGKTKACCTEPTKTISNHLIT